MTSPASAQTVVLLATYNGERFLAEQLQSLERQTLPQLDILASDDGSTDATLRLLAEGKAGWRKGRFEILEGPRRGFAENFRALLQKLGTAYDFVAFSDQDDVWDADKLEAAIALLTAGDPDRPAVYFSRTRLTDETGRPFGISPLFRRPPGFGNAIVQSIGGGNTMVLNRPAAALLAESARRTSFLTHDWWAYMLVSGAGGIVHYDPVPHMDYRQHGGNLVGNNTEFSARVKRLRMLLGGQFARWLAQNLQSLAACRDLLTDDARSIVDELEAIRATHSPFAAPRLFRAGIYRQTLAGNVSLAAAAVLGKV